MTAAVATRPVAWSFSTLNAFLTCGKQYHEVKVLKHYSDDSTYSSWGERVHTYFKKKLPNPAYTDEELDKLYLKVIQQFSKIKGELSVELQMAITNSFKPTTWFGPDVWGRAIVDALWINGDLAKAIDWKTGKRKPDSIQMLISSLLIFATYPEVEEITSAFVWLQTGKMDISRYKREDVPAMWQEVLPLIRKFEQAHKTQTWIPKQSGLCRGWCKVESCSFWDGQKSKEIK